MTRGPTNVEKLILRRMLRKAGSVQTLRAWIKTSAPIPVRGRPKGSKYRELDHLLLADVYSELYFEHEDQPSLTAAVRCVVAKGYQPSWGQSEDAVVKRLLDRVSTDPTWCELSWAKRKRIKEATNGAANSE